MCFVCVCFVCVLWQCILARITTIQEKLQKEVDSLNKTITTLVNKNDNVKSFWMFKFDLSEAQFQKTYEECFHFYTRQNVYNDVIVDMVKLYQEMTNAFKKVFINNSKLLYYYDISVNPTQQKKSKRQPFPFMQDNVIKMVSEKNYAVLNPIREQLIGTVLFCNLEFYLSTLIPHKYNSRCSIDLNIPYSQHRIKQLQISSREILHWNSLMLNFINVKGVSKDGRQIYYKHWLNETQMVFFYAHICEWIIKFSRI